MSVPQKRKILLWILGTLFSLLTLLTPSFTYAGLMELSSQYSTRSSRIDDNNFSESESITGSFAWYFFEMSAIEMSYTYGEGLLRVKADDDAYATEYLTIMRMYGADLVITFAGRDSFFQPFVKGGIVRLHKEISRKDLQDNSIDPIQETDGYQNVPSYGTGFKLNITKSIAIKASYDRWRSSNEGDREIWDDAVRGGISFYF